MRSIRLMHAQFEPRHPLAKSAAAPAGAWSRFLARQAGENIPLDTERGYHIEFAVTPARSTGRSAPSISASMSRRWKAVCESPELSSSVAFRRRQITIALRCSREAPANFSRVANEGQFPAIDKALLDGLDGLSHVTV
jgi:hypothetical protein